MFLITALAQQSISSSTNPSLSYELGLTLGSPKAMANLLAKCIIEIKLKLRDCPSTIKLNMANRIQLYTGCFSLLSELGGVFKTVFIIRIACIAVQFDDKSR